MTIVPQFDSEIFIDPTGTVLTPSFHGENCAGNGEQSGSICCCDECDYMLCCIQEITKEKCKKCDVIDCPNIIK